MTTIIPNRGAWLELESEKDDTIFANVNKLKRFQILLLGALGFTEKDVTEFHIVIIFKKLLKNILF